MRTAIISAWVLAVAGAARLRGAGAGAAQCRCPRRLRECPADSRRWQRGHRTRRDPRRTARDYPGWRRGIVRRAPVHPPRRLERQDDHARVDRHARPSGIPAGPVVFRRQLHPRDGGERSRARAVLRRQRRAVAGHRDRRPVLPDACRTVGRPAARRPAAGRRPRHRLAQCRSRRGGLRGHRLRSDDRGRGAQGGGRSWPRARSTWSRSGWTIATAAPRSSARRFIAPSSTKPTGASCG